MDIYIKQEHADTLIVFGGGGNIPLGDRSQKDLAKLALIAQQSQDKDLLKLFDGELPSIKDLQKDYTESAIKSGPEA